MKTVEQAFRELMDTASYVERLKVVPMYRFHCITPGCLGRVEEPDGLCQTCVEWLDEAGVSMLEGGTR